MRTLEFTTARLVLALLLLSVGSGWGQTLQKTQIQDTLFNADGSKVEGTVMITWKSFTAVDGSTVVNSTVDVPIVQGLISVGLTPNEGAVPSGTSYRANYTLNNGRRFSETWIVPISGSPVTVSDVRVSLPPTIGQTISQGQVTGLVDALDQKAGLDEPNVFTGLQTIRESVSGETLLGLQEVGGGDGVFFRIPLLSASTTYTFPSADGLPNQRLTTDGTGNLFWSSGGAGAGAGTAYEVIQSEGVGLTQRNVMNFSNGFSVFDNPGQTRTEIQPMFGAFANTIAEGNDPRLSDDRNPLAHASSHFLAASDAIDPVQMGALKRTNDTIVGISFTDPVLRVKGMEGQSAPLQEWRDSDNELAALITPEGSAFFREMGIAAKVGGTVVSHFFQLEGLNKFALSAVDGVFDILRYDDFGVFKDRPFRVLRAGNILTTVGVEINDLTVGPGTLKLFGDYADLPSTTIPSSPAIGNARVFLNNVSGELSVRKDNGSIVSLESGGGGGGGGSFSVFADAETPTGAINGSNVTFTLATAPNPAASLELHNNGVAQEPGIDFNLAGATITFLAGSIPQTGDSLLAWYRTSASAAGGDLTGTFPNPVVSGLQGRIVASDAPSDRQCLAWSTSMNRWEPSNCATVTDSLDWHFSGAPTAGAQTFVLMIPEGAAGVALTDVRIVANTPATTATSYTIERCTANCTSTTPTFSAVYGTVRVLAANTRTDTGGAPTTQAVNAGDQLRVNLITVGAGLADVTVSLSFQHDSL